MGRFPEPPVGVAPRVTESPLSAQENRIWGRDAQRVARGSSPAPDAAQAGMSGPGSTTGSASSTRRHDKGPAFAGPSVTAPAFLCLAHDRPGWCSRTAIASSLEGARWCGHQRQQYAGQIVRAKTVKSLCLVRFVQFDRSTIKASSATSAPALRAATRSSACGRPQPLPRCPRGASSPDVSTTQYPDHATSGRTRHRGDAAHLYN